MGVPIQSFTRAVRTQTQVQCARRRRYTLTYASVKRGCLQLVHCCGGTAAEMRGFGHLPPQLSQGRLQRKGKGVQVWKCGGMSKCGCGCGCGCGAECLDVDGGEGVGVIMWM